MYLLLLSGFITDFLATLCLFVLCVITVLGTSHLFFVIKQYLPKKQTSIPKNNKKPLQTRKRHAKVLSSHIKPIRSIEIDPSLIDKIYVKKSS